VRRRTILQTPGAALAVAATVAWGMAASCRTVAPAARPPLPPSPAPTPAAAALLVDALVPAPRLRIGILTDVPRVSIGADSGVVVWGRSADGTGIGARSAVSRATFLPLAAGRAQARFRVQVGSFEGEAGAKAVAAAAERTVGLPSTVEPSPDGKRHRVKVGDFATRDLAAGLSGRLARNGLPGAFVIEESVTATGVMRLLETGEEFEVVTVVPGVAGEDLAADAAPYRGILEVRAGQGGTLTVVNIVNLEDYLRGVVPNELSPQAFPHLEALKAQAVAARSYALSHRGDYEARGFDLCATQACQVYRGRATEHALTDQAVAETTGIVATYRGRPINAFYTSTCGGHTEDAENMFESDAAPYLKGVACAPETSAWAGIRTTASPRLHKDTPGLARDLGLLTALGVLEARPATAAALTGVPTDPELRIWTQRLLRALEREGCDPSVRTSLARRGNFVQFLVGSLCWEERGRLVLSEGDPGYLLQVEDRGELAGEGEKLATALLVSEGVLSPFPDNTMRSNWALSRAQAVELLARVAERAGPPGLLTAEFAGVVDGQLTVMLGENAASYPLDPGALLFRNLEGTRAATSELTLAVGDRVDFVLQDGRVTYLEAEQTRKGVSADRTSRYYRWEVRMTPADVARTIARYGSVGTVQDLVPQRIGVSGRVIDLAVKGDEGELLLRGLKVRWGLGLRENLFVIERERSPKGPVSRFVLTGKGWGHGVGLCQVGAFGMAQSGSTYEQIIRHYYTDVSLQKAY
jgi:stage II sporulation protein D